MRNIRCYSVLSELIDPPERMIVLRKGWTDGQWRDGTKKSYYVDRRAFDDIFAAWRESGNDILFDYEHQSEREGSPDGTVPAAGWIKSLSWDEDEGISAEIAWTEKAAGLISKREYRYFSPVLDIDRKSMRAVRLWSVALTNTPATIKIRPIAASRDSENETMKELLDALGLPEDADMSAILTAVTELKSMGGGKAKPTDDEVACSAATLVGFSNIKTADDFKKRVTDLKAKRGEPNPAEYVSMSAHQAALKEQADNSEAMKVQLDALSATVKNQARDKFIAGGVELGKITEATKPMWTEMFDADANKAAKHLETQPVLVPLGGVTTNNSTRDDSTRAKVISNAKGEWSANPDAQKVNPEIEVWVNGELASRGLPRMSDEEKKALAV